METVDMVLGIVLIVASLFLIIAVLMQHGKTHNLSGTIAGGAETFFGKTKGKSIDKKLSTITTVIAVIFVLIVLSVYLMQDSADTSGITSSYDKDAAQTTVADKETEKTEKEEAKETKESAKETEKSTDEAKGSDEAAE